MNLERYKHLKKYIKELDIDIEKGVILNRSMFNNGGYLQVRVHYRGYNVHEVLMVAAGHDLIGKSVDHLDRNKRNNKLDNLEVVTIAENTRRNTKFNIGKKYVKNSQKEQRDVNIRADYMSGKYTYKTLTEKYGVSQTQIGRILKGSRA